jgi:FHS family L-fucose permease-like MFS transporter
MNSIKRMQWLVTSTFFLWGIIASTTDIVVPMLKQSFELSYMEAMLVKSSFFMAYLLLAIPAGKLVDKIGFKPVIILGLHLIFIGSVSLSFVSDLGVYLLFLCSFFIIASGVNCLQVSSNPYIQFLGGKFNAPKRLIFSQGFNSLGTTVGPILASCCVYLLVQYEPSTVYTATHVKAPYMLIACLSLVIILLFFFNRKTTNMAEQRKIEIIEKSTESLPSSLWFGAAAIFFYVGAEVSIVGFLVLLSSTQTNGFELSTASIVVGTFWFGMMCGRFVSVALLKKVEVSTLLLASSFIAILLMLIATFVAGNISLYIILSLGFIKSVMFPSIFCLSLKGINKGTGKASGILCMAIFGGAVIPLIQGSLADYTNLKSSFIVPIFCYLYILWFAIYSQKSFAIKHSL